MLVEAKDWRDWFAHICIILKGHQLLSRLSSLELVSPAPVDSFTTSVSDPIASVSARIAEFQARTKWKLVNDAILSYICFMLSASV